MYKIGCLTDKQKEICKNKTLQSIFKQTGDQMVSIVLALDEAGYEFKKEVGDSSDSCIGSSAGEGVESVGLQDREGFISLVCSDNGNIVSLADFLYKSGDVDIIGDGCNAKSRDTFILRKLIMKWVEGQT